MSIELSKKERQLLDSMEKHVSVKEAAIAAGIKEEYANQYNGNVRKKIESATKFLEDIRQRCRRSKLIDKTLKEKK